MQASVPQNARVYRCQFGWTDLPKTRLAIHSRLLSFPAAELSRKITLAELDTSTAPSPDRTVRKGRVAQCPAMQHVQYPSRILGA